MCIAYSGITVANLTVMAMHHTTKMSKKMSIELAACVIVLGVVYIFVKAIF